MKTALLAVYHGSSDTVSMELLEADLARAFPGCPVHRAFLSSHIPEARSVEQALRDLVGYDRILIQAMLVSPGPSYERLLSLCAGHPVGPPLLACPEACAAAMDGWLPKPLVLMAHGAENTDLTGFVRQLPAGIHLAAIHGRPALEDLLPRLAGKPVHLAPFLLTAGRHAVQDLTAWQQRLEAAGCQVTIHPEPLARCPAISEQFVCRLRAAANAPSLPLR